MIAPFGHGFSTISRTRFQARADDLVQLLSMENGKVVPEAAFEVDLAAPGRRHHDRGRNDDRPHQRRHQDCCWGRRSAPAGRSPAAHRVVRAGESEPRVNLSPGKKAIVTSEPVRDPLAERLPTPTVKPFGDILFGPHDVSAVD